MKIKKKLNNNVAVVTDKIGNEIIVMGKGITYDKKAGDCVDVEQVEKQFVPSNKDFSMKFQEILLDIPSKYLEVSNCIIERAKKYLDAEIDDNIYISLTDHIHMEVKRYLDGMQVPNPLLLDIKRFYNKEYEIGCQALEIIKDQLKVELPEDEAGFIAFHFVNAQQNLESSKMVDIMKLVKEITNIVKYQMGLDFDEESVYYYRFITHLKFFAQRLFLENKQYTDEDNPLYHIVKEQYKKAFNCTQSVVKFVDNKYNYKISKEEQLYLTVHIENIITKSKK